MLPGALGCVFDVRRQLWRRLEYTPSPTPDLRAAFSRLTDEVVPGTLLLFDLGYFAFWTLDELVDRELQYVTRLREKVGWEEEAGQKPQKKAAPVAPKPVEKPTKISKFRMAQIEKEIDETAKAIDDKEKAIEAASYAQDTQQITLLSKDLTALNQKLESLFQELSQG